MEPTEPNNKSPQDGQEPFQTPESQPTDATTLPTIPVLSAPALQAVSTVQSEQKVDVLAIIGLILSFFGFIGFIISIIALIKAKKNSNKKSSTIALVGLLISTLVMIVTFVVIVFVGFRSAQESARDIKNQTLNNTNSSSSIARTIENTCFSISLPADAPSNIKLVDASGENTCEFIAQFEGLGDTPIAVGEVFSGSYSWEEQTDLITNGLADGFELDILSLGLLRTGQGRPMTILKESESTIDGQKTALFTHTSNRSISGQAHSAAIDAPAGATIGGKPTSNLYVWGAANQQNSDLMRKMLETIVWK